VPIISERVAMISKLGGITGDEGHGDSDDVVEGECDFFDECEGGGDVLAWWWWE